MDEKMKVEFQDMLGKTMTAIGLLNSMVLCGETHSSRSEKVLREALDSIGNVNHLLERVKIVKDENQREVYFDQYCPICSHVKLAENESPCEECLSNSVNEGTHKPTHWQKKERWK